MKRLRMNLKPTVVLIAILLLSLTDAAAQTTAASSVDAFIKSQMDRQKIPGVSLSVVKDGKPLIVKGYGLANVEHNVPVKPETIFQSGSVGKQFTAMAVMILVEEGKIGLDEKIAKYLGEVPASWASVTIRHLLTHTGGLTDYPEDFDFRRDYSEDDLFKRAKQIPTAFVPGEKWSYSNLGFVMLGIIIHKVSGKFYGDFLQQRVFKPLGMTTTRIISESDIVPNRSAGYLLVKGELRNQEWVSPTLNTTADGALYLTVLDMMKWDAALSAGKLLSKSGYEQMWSPVKLNSGKTYPYGFGWSLKPINGVRVIEHGGAWQGFKSYIARYPDLRLTVIVFANLGNADPGKLAHGVAEIFEPTLERKPIVDNEPKISAEFKNLLGRIAAGTADRNEFTPELQKALFDNPQFVETIKALGPIKGFQLFERTVDDALVTYNYRVDYGGVTLSFTVARDKAGKIVVFGLRPG